jgi:signal peptidase II
VLMRNKLNALVFLLVLLLDQATKLLACIFLAEGIPITIIPRVFNLTLVYNPGAAFGMFSQLPDFWRRLALVLVSLIALLVVFWFILKEAKGDKLARVALSGILAGAIGNIIDRFRFDAVVDFLDFYWTRYHWPAFNLADSAISVGVAVLVLRFLFKPHTEVVEKIRE